MVEMLQILKPRLLYQPQASNLIQIMIEDRPGEIEGIYHQNTWKVGLKVIDKHIQRELARLAGLTWLAGFVMCREDDL